MTAAQTFEIELGSGAIAGTWHTPDGMSADAPTGAIILCQGVHVAGEEAGEFLEAITQSLVNVGLCVARFEHRCSELILEDFDAHSALHDLEDALAIHRWIEQRPDIDSVRIGVLGYSMGAIAATGLSRRLESINRVCLVAPVTAQYLRERFGESAGGTPNENSPRLPASYLPSLDEIDSSREIAFHDRPTLVIHGAADRYISPTVSLEYVHALELNGRPVEHVLVARADHTFRLPSARAACLDLISRFLSRMEVVAAASA